MPRSAPKLAEHGEQVRIHTQRVEELDTDRRYDVIVSGRPAGTGLTSWPAASAGAYAIVAAAVLAESALLIGAFIPTLTLLLTADALACTGQLSLPMLIATAACAVVAGDFLAHRTGRMLGERLGTGRFERRLPAAAGQRAEALMARRGGHAAFLAVLCRCMGTRFGARRPA
ncbi:DedA family protein [Streptomyces sp. ISL-100]|uniref:DedA family protein n=1 Tax=Streptomyces sp. ISL-100 TaxID=2819173 RepID=UPI001BE83526|nr:hypothetical protein [Streptomyces sp. ISL-100]MBT2396351.1 hypothetical protein [Streptomyces sp. ISL-100]